MGDEAYEAALAGLCFELRAVAEALYVAADAVERAPAAWDPDKLGACALLLDQAGAALMGARRLS